LLCSSFCGNSQSPLQQEIEAFMNIDDSQFNLMFSARAISSLVFPFMLPWSMQHLGTRHTMYIIVASASVGQYIFIIGLREKNYVHCLVSRFIFGVSDLVTIMQNVIMCMWFTPSQLPVAFSLLLFMVKLVRAINDNVASVVYNHYQNLEIFFSIG
jgi:Na+/melibiose symporter-like transporter